MIGDWPVIIWRTLLSTAGIVLLAGGIFGYFLAPTTWWQRASLAAAGLLLVEPTLATDMIGLVLGAAVIAWQLIGLRTPRAKPAGETTPT